MYTYPSRLEALRTEKLRQTREKIELTGWKDHDDHGIVLPPENRRKIVKTMSSSGMPITDCLLDGYEVESNHPSGGFFGPKICGENYRRLLDAHPPYLDPNSSLAGAYMANFMSYRKPHWNPDFAFPELLPAIQKYKLLPGIGAAQHFCQDLSIGLELGWGGILDKIHYYRQANPQSQEFYGSDFYCGLEAIALGIQSWISRTAAHARALALTEHAPRNTNLLQIADINDHITTSPPRTFREACQWILWYQMAARMYNGSGSLGRLDVLLTPYYERDLAAGMLSGDEEAIFHIACLLLRDTGYLQLGGPDASGADTTNRVSYLVLEAAHALKIPANVGVAVGDTTDPGLLKRGVEIMFADKTGIPKFLGVDVTAHDYAKNGYDLGWGYERAYSGCHWSAIPGREYTLNDCVKINFARIFEVAFNELSVRLVKTGVSTGSTNGTLPPVELVETELARTGNRVSTGSTNELWQLFEHHLGQAVDATARALDFHMAHMHQVFPELVIDLLCHGPIEKGEDASHGGVEFYNLCVDGSALATVADSFAALEQRVEQEGRLTWQEVDEHLKSNLETPGGERARLLMRNIPRYGSGGSRADAWAVKIVEAFTRLVKAKPTPNGFNLMPGLFSWANTIPMGRDVGATPNGRRAGDPISHGANPDPGFRKDGAPTAMAVAIASVQPGYGNTAPMQMELDPGLSRDEAGVQSVCNLIRTHFQLGGTQINLNILDAAKILEAHQYPSKYPDLVVRVTGFSAYFASLSPEFRQLVVDRILTEG
jgi:formate C-acetyltransferase